MSRMEDERAEERRKMQALDALSLALTKLTEQFPLPFGIAAMGRALDMTISKIEDADTRVTIRRHVLDTFRDTAKNTERRLGNIAATLPDFVDAVLWPTEIDGKECAAIAHFEDRGGKEIEFGEFLELPDGKRVLRIFRGDAWEFNK